MAHFGRVTSFADLKKQYRTLAIEHHPDKGGDTQTMQEINAEFDKLYKVWEHRKDESTSRTGYESDFEGATSAEYQEYVYNEYRWRGSRYNGQRPSEIIETVRAWLKETYKNCKFSAIRRNYNSLSVYLITADFEVFNEEHKELVNCQLNPYHIERDERLTDRALEVMENVRSYIMSYNYDNSDAMTDYFDTNFYLHMGIGRYDKPFEVVHPQLACPKGKEAPVFKFPEGKAHKAIRLALSGSIFGEVKHRNGNTYNVLGDMHYYNSGVSFGPKYYSAPKTEKPKAEKVKKQPKAPKEKSTKVETPPINADVKIVENYSEKAFAVIGDTKPIKDMLKELGGRFNGCLTCGAGWIFSKAKLDAVKEALSLSAA